MKLKVICDYLKDQGIEFIVTGDLDGEIRGYSALNEYSKGTITWVRGEGLDYKQLILDYAIVEKKCVVPIQNKIECDNPKEAFFMVMGRFFDKNMETYQSDKYQVYGNINLGEKVMIGNGSILDGDICIGSGTIIGYDVKMLGRVRIGRNCIIKSGAVIGESDIDFYYNESGERFIKKQYGGVVIGDNVLIGPNTVINRGSLGNTTIGDNVTIDDRCNISHNVKIGNNTAIITGTALFGSTEIGENCYISTSTVRNQVKIGDNVTIGLGSAVIEDIPDSVVVAGVPARILRKK